MKPAFSPAVDASAVSVSPASSVAAASVLSAVSAAVSELLDPHPASVVAASAITVSRLTIFFFIRSPPVFPHLRLL